MTAKFCYQNMIHIWEEFQKVYSLHKSDVGLLGMVVEFSVFNNWQCCARWQYLTTLSRWHPSVKNEGSIGLMVQTGGPCCDTIYEHEAGASCRDS